MEFQQSLGLKDVFVIECCDSNGVLKWAATIDNLVVDQGINDALDKYFKGSNYTAVHYVGLTGASPTFAASDTMSNHPGWSEVTAYSETNRPTITWGTVANKTLNNFSAPSQFSINQNNVTVGGAFIVTNNTKGGTTGILYGGGAFNEGNRTLSSGDTLGVKIQASGSAT